MAIYLTSLEKWVKRYKALYIMWCSNASQVFVIVSNRSVFNIGVTLGEKDLVSFSDLINRGILSSLKGKVGKP